MLSCPAEAPLELLAWQLPPALRTLREAALAAHGAPWLPVPELTLAEAEAWAAHTPDEPWLVWRGRRCAARLAALPVAFDAGELLVGKPAFRAPAPGELDAAQATLATMPPFPGGDAGHFHPDWETLFAQGIGGLLARAEAGEPTPFARACALVLRALGAFCERVGASCPDPALGAVCARVAWAAPTSVHEALQLMLLVTVALTYAEDHYLTSPGRLDRTLARLYAADRAAGRLTREGALELLACLYIQANRITAPSLAIAVVVGGRDADGRDTTNELSYLALAARLATRLAYPTVGLAWHADTPEPLLDFATRMLATGIGCPAFFGDDLIAAGLADHGVAAADRHEWINSTCVEIKVAGASNMWVTAPYINCAQALLDALGEEPSPTDFDDLQERVRAKLSARIAAAAAGLDQVWQARTVHGGFPLASCFTRDCLARGLDFDQGGARYGWVENSFVGLANLVDGLHALRELVFERGELTLAELRAALAADFAGQERLRRRLLARPKYGNDDPAVDALARDWAEFLIATTEAQVIGGHRYVPGFFCWIQHERLGAQTGATPDGRHAGEPLADGAGAAQGRERRGPTAAVLSTTSWPHRAVLGGLVHNVKFSARLLAQPHGRQALRGVVETYLRRGGFEIQVNVVDRATLLAARAQPEQHRDLLVRVAGYSDYFTRLTDAMQREVIARTEHGE